MNDKDININNNLNEKNNNINDININNNLKEKNNEKLDINNKSMLNNYTNKLKTNNKGKNYQINNVIKDLKKENKNEKKNNFDILDNLLNENSDINNNNKDEIFNYNIINEKDENNNKNDNLNKSKRSNLSKNNLSNLKNLKLINQTNNKFEKKYNYIISNESLEIIRENKTNQKDIKTQFSFSFNDKLQNNLNSIKNNKQEDKSISCDIPLSGRNKYKINLEKTKENIQTKIENNDLINKLIEEKIHDIILIQEQIKNKITELENKINLINEINSGLKEKINEIEINKEKLEQVEVKLNASNKAIEVINEHYLLTDITNIDNLENNLYLPKFKDKRFPPSKVKSKALKKYLLNNSDEIKDNIPLFELRTENVVNTSKKKNYPSKLLIEKFEKKRKKEKLVNEIYHNQSMKFLKPLKNSFIKIPQTNFINDEK